MKAKFIQIGKAMSLILENGTVFNNKPNEKYEKFVGRIRKDVELEFELDIQELSVDSFSALAIDKLKKAEAKETGLLKELLGLAIHKREREAAKGETVDTSTADAKDAAEAAKKEAKDKANAEKEEKAAAKKAEKEAKAKAKAEAALNKPTLESILASAAEAKANVGHNVTFKAHGTGIDVQGVINGVWVDKRVPMALYRIFDADGQMFNKTIFSTEITIGDKAPDTKAEEKAKAAEAKAAEKAKKEEAKAAEKKAKEEAKTAKANEKAAAAIEKSRLKEEQAEKNAEAKKASEAAKAQGAADAEAVRQQLKAEAEAEAADTTQD